MSISEIIFGRNYDPSVIATCMRLYQVESDIKFYQVRTYRNEFKLTLTQLDPDEWLQHSPATSKDELLAMFKNLLPSS